MKHKLKISYTDDFDIGTLKASVALMLLSPYSKGKKYETSKEITAKIPILQSLFTTYFNEPFQKYLDLINNDIIGFNALIEDVVAKMQELNGEQYEITFDIKKI